MSALQDETVILQALRDLHQSLNDLKEDFGTRNERLASIETSLHTLLGNGQPGTIQVMQKQIASNTAFKNKVLGAIAVLTCSSVGEFLMFLYHGTTVIHK